MRSFTIPCLGYDLHADFYEGSDPSRILLNCIGWTSAKDRHPQILETIVELTGMSAITFNYSGHGDTDVDPLELRPAQHVLETITVFDWITAHYLETQISAMGNSYGSFMVANLALYRDFRSLVLRAPAIYPPEALYTPNRAIDRPAIEKGYRTDAAALAQHPVFALGRQFSGQALVIAHELDDVVPPTTSKAYAEGFTADYVIAPRTPHISHGASASDQANYYKLVGNWLAAH